jgi:hypothetical protein
VRLCFQSGQFSLEDGKRFALLTANDRDRAGQTSGAEEGVSDKAEVCVDLAAQIGRKL